MTEENYIEELKQGDSRAYQQLVDDFSDLVYTISLSILQNKEEAEDATQEIFTILFLSIQQFKGEAKLSTWIYSITTNKCRDILRRRRRKKRFAFFVSTDDASANNSSNHRDPFMHPGIELENQERATILFSAIDRLPDKQRIAFTLHKIDGTSYEDIASSMEMSLSAVESLIFRARQNLKRSLEAYYIENER